MTQANAVKLLLWMLQIWQSRSLSLVPINKGGGVLLSPKARSSASVLKAGILVLAFFIDGPLFSVHIPRRDRKVQQGVGHAGFATVYPLFHVMGVEPLLTVTTGKAIPHGVCARRTGVSCLLATPHRLLNTPRLV
jgi:hypothetical protein